MECEICGKALKNAHGLAIHKGHMHSVKRNIDLEAEVQTLKIMVADLTDLVKHIQAGNNGNGDNWKTLQELQAVPSGDNPFVSVKNDYAKVIDELKDVLVLIN